MHRRAVTDCRRLLAAVVCAISFSTAVASDPLPSWNDGTNKQRIVDFVASVSSKESRWHVPVAERIATFDNDGTLWSEYPIYFPVQFAVDLTSQLVVKHPELRTRQPFQAALENDLKSLTNIDGADLLTLISRTHGDMTVREFRSQVSRWLSVARHPRCDRPYTDLVFQPMLELLDLLRANKFKIYIVSGGDIEFMRVWATRIYGVPPEQIIGSRLKTRLVKRDGKPALLRLPEFEFFSNAEGKPISIRKFIGRRPIAAFGNSDGDLQMLQWATATDGKRLALIVRHTDRKREWSYDRKANIGHLDKALDEATRQKWLVVDMKRDWKVVYPFQSKR